MSLSALAYSAAVRPALASSSPSALFTSTMSASSTMPRFIPCSSSPPVGSSSSTNRSVMSATAVSAWPTPTVSTTTTSKPAASQSRMLSRVWRATPPRAAPEGDGRMKAFSSRARSAMRVLSPRIEPPVSAEEGSMESTATRRSRATRCLPSASMKVDLPTPGAPEMPMRMAPPACGARRSSSAPAAAASSARVDSTSVMARASARRSPASRGSTRDSACEACLLTRTRGWADRP